MATYRIAHETTYSYDADVTGSYGQFHLRPRDLPWQRCVAHEVVIDPAPADQLAHTDLYGNGSAYFHVVEPHQRLVIAAVSTVVVEPPQWDADALAQPWELARPADRPDVADAWEAMDFTFASPYVEIPPGIKDYAELSFSPGRPIGEASIELMRRVHRDFRYTSGATTTSTRVSALLADMRGVCQDFSHFMVSALRSLGLAGRYVSGYLATQPPPGKPRLVGADASHAWVGVWIPRGGWLYLDPTNDRLISDTHATLAWGRDYGDVPPVKGVIFSEATKSTLAVSVDMAPSPV